MIYYFLCILIPSPIKRKKKSKKKAEIVCSKVDRRSVTYAALDQIPFILGLSWIYLLSV